jgi:hypothetical protein
MDLYNSSLKTLNKKLDLISRISPNKTQKDYNTITNNLDPSIQELQYQFQNLKHLTKTPIHPLVQNSSFSQHNQSQFHRHINNDINISKYTRQCEDLDKKISNKNALVKEFENFSQLLIDKIYHLQEENEKLKAKIQSSQQYSPQYQITDKFDCNEEKLNKIIESIEDLKRSQDVFNAKLEYLNNCQVNLENEYNNKKQQEIGNHWKEMRKMNEDINLLAKESTKMKLSEEMKLNELKLQMQNLGKQLEPKLPNQQDDEIDKEGIIYEEDNIN